ncbi:MAG: succinate dehydrogenase, hydrophobic membrane anchor protein [Methylophilaceae bacterium 17-44-8]|jgi:succinate dehydrogenase / fumarate reductase membrane anchor subunit|nr:MAG: succinate dehydrogenase, hydrophobic membrane anchor protein [Methylophilales bacterium 28-44-11]OYZ00572.1 MAG: succinate dehydrogenase, hydrophobic membrane anchor protein [Methylophilales bacterium 16-45-7]OZA06497.1 MAG: succinate dehydrogenase, hydrophobic membrane anchor protein [Methylophilaceae bacterium 17-44-8]
MLIELLTDQYPGMRQWLTQRLSAVVMALYTMLFVLMLVIQQPANYQEWYAFFSPWWWRLVTFIFWICLTMHAWLGVRDVLKDYVANLTVRSYLQLLVELALIVDLVWLMMILMNLRF